METLNSSRSIPNLHDIGFARRNKPLTVGANRDRIDRSLVAQMELLRTRRRIPDMYLLLVIGKRFGHQNNLG